MRRVSACMTLVCLAGVLGGSSVFAQAVNTREVRPSHLYTHCKQQQTCAEQVVVSGWLLAKFEFAALYDDASQPGKNEVENCLGVLLPKNILSRLEQYNHRRVIARGRLNGLSELNVCGSVYLNVETLESESGSAPAISVPLDSERVRVNPALPGAEQFRAGARTIVHALASGDISGLYPIVGRKLWERIRSQNNDPGSRFSFLVSSKRSLLGLAATQRRPSVDLFQLVDAEDEAFACVCKTKSCDTRYAALETKAQSFADPYFCFYVVREEGRWFITDTVFVEGLQGSSN